MIDNGLVSIGSRASQPTCFSTRLLHWIRDSDVGKFFWILHHNPVKNHLIHRPFVVKTDLALQHWHEVDQSLKKCLNSFLLISTWWNRMPHRRKPRNVLRTRKRSSHFHTTESVATGIQSAYFRSLAILIELWTLMHHRGDTVESSKCRT